MLGAEIFLTALMTARLRPPGKCGSQSGMIVTKRFEQGMLASFQMRSKAARIGGWL